MNAPHPHDDRDHLARTPPPPFSMVVLKLIQQMQQPSMTTGDMARLIEIDPSLTASLLRLVNSPFFGLRRQVECVTDAIMVMGISAVRRQVLSVAMAGALHVPGVDAAFMNARWQACLRCAFLARQLMRDDYRGELAFTSALLHDIGQLHLLHAHGAVYAHMLEAAQGHDPRELETEHFGQAHDTLGAALLEGWGLPKALVEVARHHHDKRPLTGLSPVARAVWIANAAEREFDEAVDEMDRHSGQFTPLSEAMALAQREIDALETLIQACACRKDQ